MIGAAPAWLAICGAGIAAAAALYLVVALLAMLRKAQPWPYAPPEWPAVTVLKPLFGVEAETYACLRSFCDQAYPQFQIVFGVRAEDDPVIALVRRLQQEFPESDLDLVVDGRLHGSNRKVGNLINMMAAARHDHLVIADSDIRVEPGYLAKVVAPLLDPGVGVVTCAYRGYPRPGLWSLLGSQFINEWFLPSVRVAAWMGSREFAFGATIAMRRGALEDIGGFAAIADQLADDYQLGELTRRNGLRTVLSEVEVETAVDEENFTALVRHELRWLRTIRAVRPAGYVLSFVTFGVPVAAFGGVIGAAAAPAVAMFAVAAVARLVLHWRVAKAGEPLWHWLALPLGDMLGFTLWCWGFAARNVRWRQDRYLLTRSGSVRRYEDLTR